jgi:5,10-methylenetetrahydromethanopterin reductase
LSATLTARSLQEIQDEAFRLEALGYRGLWVGESRMRRDAVTQLTLAATATKRCYLASGVVPVWARHATVLAITWKALYELAPGRVRLGVGSGAEPMASRAGQRLDSPLAAVAEVVSILRILFAGGAATVDGAYVRADGIAFDEADVGNETLPIPIYLAAVGPRMVQLAADIADGVLLDFFLPAGYLPAVDPLGLLARRGVDRPQLLACAVDEHDPDAAVAEMRVALTRHLIHQDSLARHSGADPDLVARLRSRAARPGKEQDLRDAARDVPLSLVQSTAAAGRARDVAEAAYQRLEAGASEIVLNPLGSRRFETLRAMAEYVNLRSNQD